MPGLEEKVKRQLMASSARSLSSECIAQGWLMKQGDFNHSASGWRRRWCVLLAHRETKAVGGSQLLWYDDADASTPDGLLQLFAPPSARADPQSAGAEALRDARRDGGGSEQQIKNYKVKGHRKTGAAVGLPHCFRVELVHNGSRVVLAADTAAIADWWRLAIDTGSTSTPQPPQPAILTLSRVGMVWNTPVDLLLCEDTLVVRELGVPEIVFSYEGVIGITCRSGSEIALLAKPDHHKHPLLLAGHSAKHAQSIVAQVDSKLNDYAQQTAIPWMIERMKQKEADAAARAEERGEVQSSGLEPEPEQTPPGRQLLTLEQILDRGLGGGSGSTLDSLAGTSLRGVQGSSSNSSTGSHLLAGAASAVVLTRTFSRERSLTDQQDVGNEHQLKLHRSTPTGRHAPDSGVVSTLEEIESEFEWMPQGWRIHYPSAVIEHKSASKDTSLTLEPVTSSDQPVPAEPEQEPEPEPEPESDSNSVPPASPTLGMPPDSSAPRPSGVEDRVTIGDVGAEADCDIVDEQHEQFSELQTVARRASQTACARLFKANTSELKETVSKFCEEIKRRVERQHHVHRTAPSEEEVADSSTVLRDVSAFFEAMCAHIMGTRHGDLHDAVQLALKARAPLQLEASAVEAAIQMGIEWQIGGVVYSMIQKMLLKTAGTTRSSSGATAAENDARLLTQRDLLDGKPQRFLDIDPKLISRSEWQKPCATLGKINSATISGKWNSPAAQLDCLAKVAEDIYETIRVEHPTPAGSKPKVIAADEFTPIFVYVVLHTNATNLCALAELLWNIAPQHLLSGEGGYYLSQLTTALQFLVELDTDEEAKARAREANSVFADVLGSGKKRKGKGKHKG